MSQPEAVARRRGDYGFDAPYVPLIMGGGGTVLVVLMALAAIGQAWVWAAIAAFYALWLLLSTASFVFTTRQGKFAVWADLLSRLALRGDERVLDLGCGRGAVLLMVAQRL